MQRCGQLDSEPPTRSARSVAAGVGCCWYGRALVPSVRSCDRWLPEGRWKVRPRGIIGAMRLGIAHHFGWAVAVTAAADHKVVDRRRIELIEPGMTAAPVHHEGGPHVLHQSARPLSDDALAALVSEVRASVVGAASAALDELAAALPEPIISMSLRAWPASFPNDIAVQRRVP